ncbi:dN-sugar pyrophosphorylase [Olavius algarvensis spirochete endosymbiont]|uniref:NTP transferase domain-containing protein n=1 Tax=Olavius algarvensis spirochete endosymbiont TaxID=260710 RepID=UPI000F11927F|nr:NTP transferase domain-containing protein [Olavius algarvensis spirochete endosymbiont]VDA99116.1 dN-sugar pyrophosphorylase [Olavius algarvensis spirochete endosymbiont]
MQIIIPITGYGSRFKAAGFEDLKPFIEVHGKPIIEWVVKMFPGEDDIIFVCREKHLQEISDMKQTLKRIKASATIFAIKNWVKKGPVYDVMQAQSVIKDDEPVIVNYCDFYMRWDYQDFKRILKKENPDGAIPCYTGFHPHLIPESNVYASCKVDGNNDLIEIREKFSFEKDKRKAFHSVGTHYFKSGELLKKYCQKQIDQKIMFKNEYYSSLTYNLLCKDGLKTHVYYKISHFCQWGTPEDLKEYLFWIENIKNFNQEA